MVKFMISYYIHIIIVAVESRIFQVKLNVCEKNHAKNNNKRTNKTHVWVFFSSVLNIDSPDDLTLSTTDEAIAVTILR